MQARQPKKCRFWIAAPKVGGLTEKRRCGRPSVGTVNGMPACDRHLRETVPQKHVILRTGA